MVWRGQRRHYLFMWRRLFVDYSKDGQRFGHLSIGGEYYDIAQLSGDKHMMTRSDFSSFTGEECGTTGNEAPEISLPPAAKERNDEYCEIRVLALYNQSTVEAEGGVWAVRNRITFAIAQTNIALKKQSGRKYPTCIGWYRLHTRLSQFHTRKCATECRCRRRNENDCAKSRSAGYAG